MSRVEVYRLTNTDLPGSVLVEESKVQGSKCTASESSDSFTFRLLDLLTDSHFRPLQPNYRLLTIDHFPPFFPSGIFTEICIDFAPFPPFSAAVIPKMAFTNSSSINGFREI